MPDRAIRDRRAVAIMVAFIGDAGGGTGFDPGRCEQIRSAFPSRNRSLHGFLNTANQRIQRILFVNLSKIGFRN